MNKKVQRLSAVIKVAGSNCNLRCNYCFFNSNDQSSKKFIAPELLEKFIREFLSIDLPEHTFIWHGGEPLLAGLNYYEKILLMQQKHKLPEQKIRNGIQTNATLINKDWAKFFKINNFGIGVSLDGCEKSHDRFRIYPNGKGSFGNAMRGIDFLRAEGISFGCIQTVTKAHLADLEENFHFFTDELNCKNWGINYYLDSCGLEMRNQTVSPKEQADHIIRCIDLWLEYDDPGLEIREIENFFQPFLGGDKQDCTFRGTCGSYFCLEYNGDIYACDRFSNINDYCIGSLEKQALPEILFGDAMNSFCMTSSKISDGCRKCEWLNFCHNGCVRHRKPNIDGSYYYCETRKEVFQYARNIYAKFGQIYS